VTETQRHVVATADDMRNLGARLGEAAREGDVIMLSGSLGSGKTTITQGIGRGLGIAEQITSPTFVIARVHANPTSRPDLVHVDAYRLGSLAEVADLELEADLPESVIVVEWGAGLVDGLGESPVLVRIDRSEDEHDDVRRVEVSFSEERWSVALRSKADG
jgi:tRNA threonylcarbamoyladenosine biosynthesis protein TsaE